MHGPQGLTLTFTVQSDLMARKYTQNSKARKTENEGTLYLQKVSGVRRKYTVPELLSDESPQRLSFLSRGTGIFFVTYSCISKVRVVSSGTLIRAIVKFEDFEL